MTRRTDWRLVAWLVVGGAAWLVVQGNVGLVSEHPLPVAAVLVVGLLFVAVKVREARRP